MRGTHWHWHWRRHHCRFIPAHAGNTASGGFAPASSSVHPRACGEHSAGGAGGGAACGSSPRMRGTRYVLSDAEGRVRFIPAHAGNTSAGGAASAAVAVHPRACGEHPKIPLALRPRRGSSPRMRGTHAGASAGAPTERFIPAHAGNTVVRPLQPLQPSVHPRACGEHGLPRIPLVKRNGSSPRMRGTHWHWRWRRHHCRFIPAHAGNTAGRASCSPLATVHPRACGEHRRGLVEIRNVHGSSPRMRGTPLADAIAHQHGRFIPAHAGNTRRRTRMRHTRPVHPRACGEHRVRGREKRHAVGSSPRMRGTQLRLQRHHRLRRFIPAHAGNTSRTCGKR